MSSDRMSTDANMSSIRKRPSASNLSAGSVSYILGQHQHNKFMFLQYTAILGFLLIIIFAVIAMTIYYFIKIYNKNFKNKDIEDDK